MSPGTTVAYLPVPEELSTCPDKETCAEEIKSTEGTPGISPAKKKENVTLRASARTGPRRIRGCIRPPPKRSSILYFSPLTPSPTTPQIEHVLTGLGACGLTWRTLAECNSPDRNQSQLLSPPTHCGVPQTTASRLTFERIFRAPLSPRW